VLNKPSDLSSLENRNYLDILAPASAEEPALLPTREPKVTFAINNLLLINSLLRAPADDFYQFKKELSSIRDSPAMETACRFLAMKLPAELLTKSDALGELGGLPRFAASLRASLQYQELSGSADAADREESLRQLRNLAWGESPLLYFYLNSLGKDFEGSLSDEAIALGESELLEGISRISGMWAFKSIRSDLERRASELQSYWDSRLQETLRHNRNALRGRRLSRVPYASLHRLGEIFRESRGTFRRKSRRSCLGRCGSAGRLARNIARRRQARHRVGPGPRFDRARDR
jgi:hypothetical protein